MEFIDLHKQYEKLKKDIDKGIFDVINSTHFISGEPVKDLENQLKEYVGVKYCLTCANGTDALTLALRAIDVQEGDAVFVSNYTYFASAEVIALEKASPIFVDVNCSFNMDPQSLEKAIVAVLNEGILKPKAIIVVDLFGQVADFEKIRPIADKYNLLIIEDGAQAFGGSVNNQKACSFGDIATTSFFPVKPLGCYGDGGAIFTNKKEYYDLMCSLAVHGKGEDKYDNVRIGYNSRLDTLQAAILIPKLKAFKEFELADRNTIANIYTSRLGDCYITPLVLPNHTSSWAQYTLLAKNEIERQFIMDELKKNGIPTMIYYKRPMHLEKVFAGVKRYVSLENSESFMKRAFSIPMHPYLDAATQNSIINLLLEISGGKNK